MVNITITVNGEIEDLKAGFLKAIQRPDQYKDLTDIQFFKKWIEDNITMAYETGKKLIAQETTPPDITENIVTVS